MRPNLYILNALKYATYTVAGAIVVVAGIALTKQGSMSSLTGRLVAPQESGVIPTAKYDEKRSIEGFFAPADTHVIFTVPQGTRTPRITFFGGRPVDQTVRYWGYCFSGNEAQNKAAGMRGKALYDGNFFYSLAERKAQMLRPKSPDNDLLGVLEDTTAPEKTAKASIQEIFYAGLCYVMVDGESAAKAGFGGGIPAGVDIDGDEMNGGMETKYGTNPAHPDTDQDGLLDGVEVYVATTNPLELDSDHDGLADGCEDENRDGKMDKNETSPLSADSDRDTLCDGNGFGAGCPETKQPYCYQDQDNNRVCSSRPLPPYGEDMNSNCKVDDGETDPMNPTTFGIPDYDYKWNQFVTKYGRRPQGQGVDAPEFPIPGLPVDLNDNIR